MPLQMGVIAPHVPSICFEEKAPEFQREIIAGLKKVSGIIDDLKPDVVITISCHWPSTFDHIVDVTPVHKGNVTAEENPNLISDVPYNYPGDYDLGMQIVEAGQKAGLPVISVDSPHYVWDYGTLVPLRYLVPKENIPIIDMSICLAADLDETYKFGQVIGSVLEQSSKKAVFVASGALSHRLVRGRENKPTITEQAMDNQMIEFLNKCDLASAWKMLPQYAKFAAVEGGGRHLAMLFGVLGDAQYTSQYFGWGQSSGSGNVVMTFQKQ